MIFHNKFPEYNYKWYSPSPSPSPNAKRQTPNAKRQTRLTALPNTIWRALSLSLFLSLSFAKRQTTNAEFTRIVCD
jgi:hypothetical protein